MRTSISLLLSAVALVAIGCGEDTIDAPAIEAEIKDDLAADVGITPKSIDCPDETEAQAGKRFRCIGTAPSDGSKFRINVRLTDDGGFRAVVPPEQFR